MGTPQLEPIFEFVESRAFLNRDLLIAFAFSGIEALLEIRKEDDMARQCCSVIAHEQHDQTKSTTQWHFSSPPVKALNLRCFTDSALVSRFPGPIRMPAASYHTRTLGYSYRLRTTMD